MLPDVLRNFGDDAAADLDVQSFQQVLQLLEAVLEGFQVRFQLAQIVLHAAGAAADVADVPLQVSQAAADVVQAVPQAHCGVCHAGEGAGDVVHRVPGAAEVAGEGV